MRLRTFNMGLGMLLVINAKKFKKTRPCSNASARSTTTWDASCKGERKVMYLVV
jgi:phosphoribosylaminoimidazole (AIR) synthetase